MPNSLNDIAEALRSGASSDIWYDASFDTDEEDRKAHEGQIEGAQKAMTRAADILDALPALEAAFAKLLVIVRGGRACRYIRREEREAAERALSALRGVIDGAKVQS